jgi:hypothetical protein
MRPRQFSENLISTKKVTEDLVEKYRDYVRHLTKNYTLTDEELDEFVENWDESYDIRQMSLSLVVEDEDDVMTALEEKHIEELKKKSGIKDMRVSITSLGKNKGILGLLKQ